MTIFPYKATVANRTLNGENKAKTYFLQEPLIVDHHEINDSCLALAPDLSTKKIQSRKNFSFDERTQDFDEMIRRIPEGHK